MQLSYKDFSTRIRRHCLYMAHLGKSGHIGSMLSCADIMAVLYGGKVLRYKVDDPKWSNRDRFIMSKGHAGAAVYAALAEVGFFPMEWMDTYYQDDGKLMGHISHYVPGVEYSTGSLGHGLSVCCGLAMAAKEKKANHRIFCMLSDGDCNEGSTWEAIMFAGQRGFDNIVAIVDYNKIQALGFVKDIINLGDLKKKLTDFGWSVKELDGHDHIEIEKTLLDLPFEKGKPSFIIANTVKGKGVSFLENTVASHYAQITDKMLEDALKELGDN